MNQISEIWTEEKWRNWLGSTEVGAIVRTTVTSRFDRFRKEIRRAWNYSLSFACVGATLSVLALGWFLHDSQLNWSSILVLLAIANGTVFVAWFLTFWVFFGTSPTFRPYEIQTDIAVECEEAALDACSSALYAKESRLREIAKARSSVIEATIKSALQRISLDELELQFLTKLSGARFVESAEGDLQIYFAHEHCERCQSALRSSDIRRLAIEPLRAQAAGLERADIILPRPIGLVVQGTCAQFEEFFQRSPNSVELLSAEKGTLECNFCEKCSEVGLTSGPLRRRSYDVGLCPVCGAPISNAHTSGFWDGEGKGGLMIEATCYRCDARLAGLTGLSDSMWRVIGRRT